MHPSIFAVMTKRVEWPANLRLLFRLPTAGVYGGGWVASKYELAEFLSTAVHKI
jgi:hypothetical protein